MKLARSEEMRDLLRSFDPAIGWVYRDGAASAPGPRAATPLPNQPPPQPPSPPSTRQQQAQAQAQPEGGAPVSPQPAVAGDVAGATQEGTPPQVVSSPPTEAPPPASGPSDSSSSSGFTAFPGAAGVALVGALSIPLPDDEASKLGQLLAQACFFGDLAEVRTLLDAGADANSRDSNGMTGLHWVASRGGVEAAEALIAAGADVNAATSKEGWTPLHWAARAGRADVARALLMSGAAIAARNTAGRTPLQMCTSDAVKELLISHGGGVAQASASGSPVPVVQSPGVAAAKQQSKEDQDVILRELQRIRNKSGSRSPSPLPPQDDSAPSDSAALAKALSNVNMTAARGVSPRRVRYTQPSAAELLAPLSGNTPLSDIDAQVRERSAAASGGDSR